MTDERARAAVLADVEACRDETVQLLCTLVRIPSATGSDAEHEAQSLLAGWLVGAGFDVDHWALDLDTLTDDADFPGMEAPRTEAWGLVGRLAGSGDGPSLMLDGHVDVVPPGDRTQWSRDPYSGAIESGAVHGRGSCDMKGGVVASLVAARAVRRSGVRLRGDLLVASVVGEEDGGLGTFATLRRGWRADACVIPEPTELDLVPACAGALTFRLVIQGLATHASRRTDGVSAVEKLGPVLAALRTLEARRNTAVDPIMARWPIAYPLEIGVVHAGDWPSTVPDRLVAEGRLGVALDEPVESARAALEEAVAEVSAADPWLRDHPVTVQWWGGQFASGRLLPPGPAGTDLATAMRRAHHDAGGSPQREWGAPYGTDLRLLSTLAGIPTLHYGPGDAGLAHAADERVPVAQVLQAARALAVLAVDHCGVA